MYASIHRLLAVLSLAGAILATQASTTLAAPRSLEDPARATAAAYYQYSVEYRDDQQTGGEWRTAVAWTTDYDYAKSVYDYLVNQNVGEVRLYRRTVQ